MALPAKFWIFSTSSLPLKYRNSNILHVKIIFSMPNLEIPILCFQMMTPKFKPKNKFESFYFQEVVKHWIWSFLSIQLWSWSFLNFLSNGLHFWNSMVLKLSGNFHEKTLYHIPLFLNLQKFWSHGSQKIRKVHLTNQKSGFGSCYPFSQPPLSTMSLVTKVRFIWKHKNIIALLK